MVTSVQQSICARRLLPRIPGPLLYCLIPFSSFGADRDPASSLAYLKRLPLEELAEVEVTTVSRQPQKLSLAPSAIEVLRGERIDRAGATNIPDALRLASGIHVAQVSGHEWAISARGFNAVTANKLQVLMDGRSIYTPLFSGVFWDVQHVFMPDLEAIEVIRGPGATLWGANAVNGVINIRSKRAQDTQGWLLHGGAGIEERGFGGLRYGGQSGNTYYRAYVMGRHQDALRFERGGDAEDDLQHLQGGFRIDTELAAGEALTVQGDIYQGRFGQPGADDAKAEGGNVIARWSRDFGADENLMLQLYFDRTHRLIPGVFEEDRDTYDLELQHRFAWGERHRIVWGLNYRASHDQIGNLGTSLAFLPDDETLHLGALYLHDTIAVIPDRFSLMLGSRFEYNSFSGFEIQPTARFSLQGSSRQTLWGAVSRAVRTPTRIDQDLFAPNPASGQALFLESSRSFRSEELIAYELGYRLQAAPGLSFDLALFYHDYDRIRSVEPQGPGEPLLIANGLDAESYGATLTMQWQAASWWRLRLGYTLLETRIHPGRGSRDTSGGAAEGNDPNHIFVAHSSMDLPGDLEFDAVLRYVDRLPNPRTAAYLALDLRLGWHVTDDLELAIVGRNLLDEGHPEFERATGAREVERSVFGTITWQF